MNKILLSATAFVFAVFINTANAQYSQGGTPYSFTNNVNTLNPVVFNIMPPIDLDALRAQDAINDPNKGPFRFGFNHYVNLNLNNSGTWTTLPNGDRLWQMGIKSTGAHTINLAFDDFFMPEGASTFIYNADKSFVIGAFTSLNNDKSKMFATDLIAGDAIIIEYYEPKEVTNQGRINLFRATHGYRGVEEYVEKSFGQAGSCQVNVNCPLGSNWQQEKKGVVCLVVNGGEFCSGSLINDVPQDKKPYILTANHCSTNALEGTWTTWVFRFNWESPTCTNPGSNPASQSLNNSTLRARNANSDFCLVEITGGLVAGTVPNSYNTYFNGWSNINTPATSEIGIHHPSGDIKKISQSTNPCVSDTWSGTAADSHWRTGIWTTGCTEGGSSGSPLLDQNHRIVGQLHGGPSLCGHTGNNMLDYYGKFAVSWLGAGQDSSQLKHWLDPNNTGATVLNGFDPVLGITENTTSTATFNIYPNPSDGIVNLEINVATPQTITIKVINILGQQITSTILTNSSNTTHTIDLTNQSKGMYFVEITTSDAIVVKKINIIK